jgi:hypothetical protein
MSLKPTSGTSSRPVRVSSVDRLADWKLVCRLAVMLVAAVAVAILVSVGPVLARPPATMTASKPTPSCPTTATAKAPGGYAPTAPVDVHSKITLTEYTPASRGAKRAAHAARVRHIIIIIIHRGDGGTTIIVIIISSRRVQEPTTSAPTVCAPYSKLPSLRGFRVVKSGKTPALMREFRRTAGGGGLSALRICYARLGKTHCVYARTPSPALAPLNTVVPAISGNPTEGQTLSESHGTWSSPAGFNYQWLDCDAKGANCTAISGATADTYTLGPSDVGHTIRVRETARNTEGRGAPATSAPTTVVVARPKP